MNRFLVNVCPRSALAFGLGVSLLLLWWAVVLTAPVSTGLRDSGEFIVQAVFLDIAHPAGFPLLAQLDNLLTWIPFGPLAWRVTLFAGVAAAALVIFGLGCARSALDRAELPARALWAVVPLFSLVLLLSPAMQRQLAAVEAYLLNGAFSAAFVYAAFSYEKKRDNRLLIALGFIAGLAVGNHVASAVAALCIGLYLLIRCRPSFAVICAAVFFSLLGIGVYGYLPARAATGIPLNTGSPGDAPRFFRQVSDARDRELRGAERTVPADVLAVSRISIGHDARKLFDELPVALWIVAAIGFFALAARSASAALLVMLPAVASYVFFSGWDPDPWVPIFGAAAVFALIGVVAVARGAVRVGGSCLEKPIAIVAGIGGIAWAIAVVYPRWQERAFDRELPGQFAAALLDSHAGAGALVVENSWFITQYVQRVESYRSELATIYQPSLLFPGYFAPATLRIANASFEAPAGIQGREADLGVLKRFIESLVMHGFNLGVEAGELLSPIQPIVSYTDRGTLVVSADRQARYDAGYAAGLRELLHNLAVDADDSRSPSADESRNFVDNQVGAVMRFFDMAGQHERIAESVQAVCQQPEERRCSATIWNALAADLFGTGEAQYAAEIIRRLSAEYPEQQAIFKATLHRFQQG